MANWAIVIGVDKYWTEEACLLGAVRDALKMRAWLMSVDGGAVPARNLTLLLSPAPDGAALPAGLVAKPATRDNFVTSVEELLQQSRGEGDRFFFYYSGHGLAVSMGLYEESGLVFEDFTDILTDKALSLRSIYELFKATRFREQFFVIDACRNIPWEEPFRISEYPKPRRVIPPVPPQWIMYATSPGLKALELQEAGSERGAFTEALLAALGGDAAATTWDEEQGQHIAASLWDDGAQEYVLKWESLCRYVEAAVKQQKLVVDHESGAGYLIQEPRQTGEHGAQNPTLGRFASGAYPAEKLAVQIDPLLLVPEAQVLVRDLGDIEQSTGITQNPVEFTLPRRTYSVRVTRVPAYRSERSYYTVHLYGPSQVPVRLLPGTDVQHGFETARPAAKGLNAPRAPGSITASASDPLAKIELTDNTGQPIASGEGYVAQAAAPGFYRVRLVTPEGVAVERSLEVLPGEDVRVALDAPPPPDTPLFNQVLAKAGIPVAADNTIEPSEAMSPVATAHLSTILALAGGAANEDTWYGTKLRRIGIGSFRELTGSEAKNGVQALFAIEAPGGTAPAEPAAYLAQCGLRCLAQEGAPAGEAVPPAPIEGLPGVGEIAWPKDPGSYWLALDLPGQPSLAFAVQVLPNRLALFLFQRRPQGEFRIYQYLPALAPGELDHPDSRKGAARFPVLQRSELIQRQYLSGRLEQPKENALELLYAKWFEPIAGVLGSHILTKVEPTHPLLDLASNNMVRYFPELPDSHVLRGDYLARIESAGEAAAAAYAAALDRGLPIMRESLANLVHGLDSHHLEHPRADLARRVLAQSIPGLLWTAVPLAGLT